jgi:hypothetical protein
MNNISKKLQVQSRNQKALKMIKEQQNGVSGNFGYEAPMPWMSSEVISINGIDHVKLRGTEYLTTVEVSTTQVLDEATNPGDCLFSTPIHPRFFSGTRLLTLTRLYQKYRYIQLLVEYVPIVPSTQDGSLIAYFTYDPNENIFLQDDEDTRLREAMSHLGAQMFNVYTYGRTSIHNDDSSEFYFVHIGGDSRLENQGTFNIAAGSTFSPPLSTEATSITLGNLILHYEVELKERGLDEDLSDTFKGSVTLTSTTTVTLSNFTGSTAPLAINNSYWLLAFGFNLMPWHIVIVKTLSTWLSGVNPILVDTPHTKSSEQAFTRGSIWYLRIFTYDDSKIGIYTNLGDALEEILPASSASNLTGTDVMSGSAVVWVYDIRIDN